MFKQILKDLNLLKKNYLNQDVPVIGGIVLIILLIITFYRIYLLTYLENSILDIYFFLIIIIGLTGLLDDMVGDRGSQGFKGHLKSLFKGELTTGIIKIVVTFSATVLILINMDLNNLYMLGINAGIILFMTNLLNLLDLRPGRSIKFFLIISFLLILIKYNSLFYLLPFVIIIIFYLPFEMKALVMLGDSGANLLGVVLGFNISYFIEDIYIKSTLFLLLMILNIMSEKYSFSEIIEKNNTLKWIDNLGR